VLDAYSRITPRGWVSLLWAGVFDRCRDAPMAGGEIDRGRPRLLLCSAWACAIFPSLSGCYLRVLSCRFSPIVAVFHRESLAMCPAPSHFTTTLPALFLLSDCPFRSSPSDVSLPVSGTSKASGSFFFLGSFAWGLWSGLGFATHVTGFTRLDATGWLSLQMGPSECPSCIPRHTPLLGVLTPGPDHVGEINTPEVCWLFCAPHSSIDLFRLPSFLRPRLQLFQLSALDFVEYLPVPFPVESYGDKCAVVRWVAGVS